MPRRIEELRGTAVGASGSPLSSCVWAVVQTATTGVVQPLDRRRVRHLHHRRRDRPHHPARRPRGRPARCGRRAGLRAARRPSAASTTTQDVWQVVSLTALASFLGALPHVTAGRSPRVDEIARRILGRGLRGRAVPAAVRRRVGPAGSPASGGVQAVVMVAIVLATGVFDAAVSALVRADRNRAPYRSTLRDELRALLGLGLGDRRDRRPDRPGRAGHGLVGDPGLLRAPAAHAVLVPPLRRDPRDVPADDPVAVAGHRGRRLHRVRSRAPRERDLASRSAASWACREDELLDLEYAALMHDIGQLSLDRADPRRRHRDGRPGRAAPHRRARRRGHPGDRACSTGSPTIVERQADPYRRPGEHADAVAARSSADHQGRQRLRRPGRRLRSSTARRLDALERLRLGMAYDFDPRVVETLARIVARPASRPDD